MAYQNLGREKLLGVCEALKEIATPEGSPRMEGRMMGILLAPGKKKSAPKPAAASKPKSSVGGEAAAAEPGKAQAGQASS